ncbi:23S rRNA (adenine(1618)-N(6))-methyltransferase RlmF [Alteromonadaceae bacterium BrNp21-10]|nr:23S rRNA (adenine(1618)-N(6))-methyltransferase RlmF [Alteromonadaceae bacterium BrNp21-10]
MHPNNLHKEGYDFSRLLKASPELAQFVVHQADRRPTIDFSNALAVKTLNRALLKHYYKLEIWDIPDGYLCPPVPGRADYIHHIADLLATTPPRQKNKIVGLDIGVGANVIYPIIGSQLFGWHFVGSELDPTSFKSAQLIVNANKNIKNSVTIRQQTNPAQIFKGIIQPDDQFSFTLCNPPFHASAQEANAGSQRKNHNLGRNKQKRGNKSTPFTKHEKQHLNFAGQHNELWCHGGEAAFIKQMIIESLDYAKQVQWFTCLVSKKQNLHAIYQQLNDIQATDVKTINMSQGSKISRFVAWRF